MSQAQNVLAIIIVSAGVLFMLVGSIGILRFPDFYTRTHAASKADTVGIVVLLTGLAIYEGLTLSAVKLLLAICFISVANPVAAHALARTAMRFGLRPWLLREGTRTKEEKDDLAN